MLLVREHRLLWSQHNGLHNYPLYLYKIIIATGVATETDVDFIDSSGAARTVNFEAAGESVSCIYNDTTSAWQTIAYGATAAANNVVGSQDVT